MCPLDNYIHVSGSKLSNLTRYQRFFLENTDICFNELPQA